MKDSNRITREDEEGTLTVDGRSEEFRSTEVGCDACWGAGGDGIGAFPSFRSRLMCSTLTCVSVILSFSYPSSSCYAF